MAALARFRLRPCSASPVAIALVLFAVDVLRVGDSVTEDDVRFQARPTLQAGLFDDPGLLPGSGGREGGGL